MTHIIQDEEDLLTGRPPETPGPTARLIDSDQQELSEYVSAERVVGLAPDGSGRTVLLYPLGARIPLDEAIRQGLAEPDPATEPEPKPKRRRTRKPA